MARKYKFQARYIVKLKA